MTDFARTERLALTALFRAVGPDAPTLCEGWDARDLAVHLVIRDRDPLALPGHMAPAVAKKVPWLGKRTRESEETLHAMPWDRLVGRVGEGEPRWSPLKAKPLRELANAVEFLVHHEDVRRAQEEWAPRRLPEAQLAAALRAVKGMAIPVALKDRKTYVLEAGDHGTHRIGRTGEVTTLHGEPTEMLLWFFGRRDHALVSVDRG
ncbi:TIGR03085 family metal-binding protein [Brevibacterium litoralis]|uniref:TIGR03085 family metal-binding protein n=1 Tax=Brevibacterium litoralis TaxID=3138935 RepID=UPI0032EE5DD3